MFGSMLVSLISLNLTIAGLLGSEEQKRELLPRMAQLQLIGAWGLTEPSNGSDASALTSTAFKARPLIIKRAGKAATSA